MFNPFELVLTVFNRIFFGITAVEETPVTTSVKSVPSKLSAAGRKAFQHAPGTAPPTTTGRVMFFNGTTDGEEAFVDFAATKGPKHNLAPQAAGQVTLTDIRNYDPPCTLEVEGCTFVHSPASLREEQLKGAKDQKEAMAQVQAAYFKECADLVTKLTGASKAVPYHFRYRHVEPDTNVDDEKNSSTKPAVLLHLDNDKNSATATMKEYIGAESEEWLGKHWMILNVWRPLSVPATQYPLSVIDPQTFDFDRDQAPIYTRNNYKSNILAVKENPDYNFYYVSDLKPEEALVFRNYESKPDGTSRTGMPHGAFTDANTPADAPPRRSIEVRVLALFNN